MNICLLYENACFAKRRAVNEIFKTSKRIISKTIKYYRQLLKDSNKIANADPVVQFIVTKNVVQVSAQYKRSFFRRYFGI